MAVTKNLKIEKINVSDLIPYINNSRTHSETQINQIVASIREFGFCNPVLIDEKNGLIAGHGRLLAAQKIGMETVPAVRLVGLTKAQKKAYVIADNQIALNAGWDLEMLQIEIGELKSLDFDLDVLAFDDDFLEQLDADDVDSDDDVDVDSKYTKKIATPIYEIKGENPKLSELYNNEKPNELIREIEQSDVPDDVRAFLVSAAMRHTKFNYEKIAEYYAHCNDDIKRLFERSALVIVDYDSAIENGYIQLTEKIMELSDE